MARSRQKPLRQGGFSRVVAAVTLAWWQFRLTWRLLLVVGAGVLAAVVLVCAVPLYSQVALSAGLRDALNAPGASSVTIHSEAHLISQTATEKVSEQIQQMVEQNIGPFLAGEQFSAQSPALPFGQGKLFQLIGWSIGDAEAHVRLLAGHLPRDEGKVLEIAITPQTAAQLKLRVGTVLSLPLPFLDGLDNQSFFYVPLRVSGIFRASVPGENFWHGADFVPQTPGQDGRLYTALVSNNSYFTVLEAASLAMSHGDPQNGTSFENPTDLYWYYNLDLTHLDINHLDALSTGLNNLLVSVSDQPVAQPFVDNTTSSGPSDLVNGYSDRVTVARIPLLSLSYIIAGLILFFVGLMSSLLVDRQASAIALWRARGASREQVFSALLAQSVGIGLFAFAFGPFISLLAVRVLAQISLSVSDQGALNVILTNPLAAVLRLSLTVLTAVLVSIMTMVFALVRAARVDALTAEQGHVRQSRGPLWTRAGLDLLAGVLALLGYGLAEYIASPGLLDERTRVLILPPLTLIGAACLLLGCLLLFLRLFPLLLAICGRMVRYGRGAISLLTMAQMAQHAPRQGLRMSLLLALAVAFGIFSLVFAASQTQRIPTVAAYQVGANFSGTYPVDASLRQQPLVEQEEAFNSVPGVNAASVGYISSTRGAPGGVNAPLELRAVDADSFAATALWTGQDSSQSLSSLMRQLVERRKYGISQQLVPAIVDEATWKTLGLTPGASFTLSDLNGTINYVEVAEVAHIPTVNDSAYASGTGDYVALGGVLVDFTTYQAVQDAVMQESTPMAPTTVWLNTATDAASLASVRAALASGPLHLLAINDLQAQEAQMSSDPLSLALLGVLLIGAFTALLLSLIGNVTLSWLSIRSRLVNYTVMRALGTAPGQLAGVITGEQVIIYATALGLGVAFGILLSYLVLPAFVFTAPVGDTVAGTGVFYIMQSVPPIQMIVPGVLIALVIGVLVAVCLVIVGIVMRFAAHVPFGNTLRLPGD